MARTVVVILEGATPHLLDRWGRDGSLPWFQELLRQGTSGDLSSLPVPYELPAQLTAFSGAPPGEHGCFSCWRIHGECFAEEPRVIDSDDIGVPLLWEHGEGRRLRAGVINLFGTHPPRPTNGFQISYPFYPTLHGCAPEGLLRDLLRSGIRYAHDASVLYRGGPRDEFHSQVERVELARMEASLNLLERGVELLVANLTILDRLSHFWWREIETPGLDDKDTVLWRAYRLVDGFLGRLLQALRPDDHLLAFSEMSFGALEEFFSLNEVLERAGLLRLKDQQLDPARTVAMEAVQGSHGINLNLRRRHGTGMVSEAQEDSCFQEVSEALLAARHPRTGRPLLKSVRRGEELYPGARAKLAPDLVVEPFDERYLPLGNPRWAIRVHRQLQSGWHRRASFWLGVGPRFSKGSRGPDAACADIAHTLADLLHLEPPPWEGHSLAGVGHESQVMEGSRFRESHGETS